MGDSLLIEFEERRESKMKQKKFSSRLLDCLINLSVKNSANSTTSGTMFQPKTPTGFKKFSKINDK